jgi:protein dithiol:quinone oxidoreductase
MKLIQNFKCHEKALLLFLTLAPLGLLAGAYYLQVYLHEDPCPLCIIQRYLFLATSIFSFLALMTSLKDKLCTKSFFELLAFVATVIGVGVAFHHVDIQAHPSFNCGFDQLEPIVDGLLPAKIWPLFFKVSGLCETPYPPILGLSVPQWSFVAFSVFSLILIYIAIMNIIVKRKTKCVRCS